MAYNRIQAKRICSTPEYELFEHSLSDRIGRLDLPRLRTLRQRCRNLRDKYRDLDKRQRLANRERTGSKKGDRFQSNRRTEQKVRLFAETLGRFDQRIASLEAPAKKPAARASDNPGKGKKTGGRAPAPGNKNKASGAKTGFMDEKAQAATQRRQDQKIRGKAVMGHTRSATRRRQARRDSK